LLRRISTDTDADGNTAMTIRSDRYAIRRKDEGLDVEASAVETYRVRADDPLAASMEADWNIEHARGDWRIRCEAKVHLSATKEAFRLTAAVKTFDGDVPFAEKSWDETIKRDGI